MTKARVSSHLHVSTSYETFGDGALAEKSFVELYSSQDDHDEKTKNILPKWLTERCLECGWTYPTIVQQRAFDAILCQGKDAIIQSQTGSGKTLAYLLPLLASIDPTRSAVQAFIIVPTRELGVQVARVSRRLAIATKSTSETEIIDQNEEYETNSEKRDRIMIMSVLEGSSNKRALKWARAEPPHVVIGTPTELTNMVRRGGMKYNSVRFVVVDEVDACLLQNSGNFSPSSSSSSSSSSMNLSASGELHELLSRYLSPTYDEAQDEASEFSIISQSAGKIDSASRVISHGTDRQTILVSATIPQHNHFIKQCVQNQWTVRDPVHVCASPGELIPPTLKHFYVVCSANEQKMMGLKRTIQKIMKKHSMEDTTKVLRILIFCDPRRNMEQMADILEAQLGSKERSDNDIIASVLRYEDSTSIRNLAMEKFRGDDGNYLGGRVLTIEEEGHDVAVLSTSSEDSHQSVRILLSTDVAARGLDILDISYIINFDLPNDGDSYVHRGGRAGRLGRKGAVMSIITSEQEFVLERLANTLNLDDLKCISRQTGAKKRKK